MKIAVLGRTKMLFDTIDALMQDGNEIVLIGTCKAEAEYSVNEKDYQMIAHKLSVPFFCSSKINSAEILQIIRGVGAEIAVSVNWLTILGEEVISSFPMGVLNAHCGDLPRYRGNACPNWAIINGENEYALCIHYMEPYKLDAGNILLKKYYPINDNTTITDIYENLEKDVPKLFCNAIKKVSNHEKGVEQSRDPKDSLRCYPRIPNDGFIDWEAHGKDIVRLIRASCKPFEGAFTFYGEDKIHIMDAMFEEFDCPCSYIPGQIIEINRKHNAVSIASGDGKIIVKNVEINGKRYNATEIFTSLRIRLNYCSQNEIWSLRKKIMDMEERISEMERRLNQGIVVR